MGCDGQERQTTQFVTRLPAPSACSIVPSDFTYETVKDKISKNFITVIAVH